MTFVSKYGRRTSTEDLSREVALQSWRKCLAVATMLLLQICGAQDAVTDQNDSQNQHHAETEENPSRNHIFRVPPSHKDLNASVQQVSASAKDCQQRYSKMPLRSVNPKLLNSTNGDALASDHHHHHHDNNNNATAKLFSNKRKPVQRPSCSQLHPFLNKSRNFHQCLYVDELSTESACAKDSRNHLHLRFCSQYNLGHLLPQGERCGRGFLDKVKEMDDAAKLLSCQFDKLLELYDCETSYSVSWTCSTCKRVYKQWVCAMVLPFHMDGEFLKPCRSVCRLVEQMCPYFHPSVKEQYAGERVFKCIDPDIPDLESISPHSVFGPPGRCYCPHHLDLTTETLISSECMILRQQPTTTTTTTTTTMIPATNSSSETSGNSSVTTADSNRTHRSSSTGTSSCACHVWLILLLMTLHSRNLGVFTSEPT